MPYTPPADVVTRNHHRTRSFTTEQGPGAFAPLAGVPRRTKPQPQLLRTNTSPDLNSSNPPPPTVPSPTSRGATFHFKGSSSDSDQDDDDDDDTNDRNVAITITEPPSDAIPFPSIVSPLPSASFASAFNKIPRASSTPQMSSNADNTPSVYRSPYANTGRTSPTAKPKRPLKPSLKSNHSSPHLPSLATHRSTTQSTPTTPNVHPSMSGYTTPRSPFDSPPPSLPQTPKSVHFAAEKSSLESVVVFSKGARPRSLSTGGNDTETETEGYDSSTNNWAAWPSQNRYPFPVMPSTKQDASTTIVLDNETTSDIPALSSVGNGGSTPGNPAEKKFVYLETLMLPGTRPPTLKGSILVRNIAFQKRVAVRFTMDDWQTVSEVSCQYAASLPGLPPPFASGSTSTTASHQSNGLNLNGGEGYANASGGFGYHNRSASLNSIMTAVPPTGKVDSWDRFTFTIKLEDVERTLVTKKIFLVVRYDVPSQWGWECGGEWWDNNDAKNYQVCFKLGKKISAVAPSTAADESASATHQSLRSSARAKASNDAAEARRQTASLPPLPPPGPIRPMSLPGLTSLRSKVDQSGLLPSPIFRQGRAPTFKESTRREIESPPPGSPTQRVFPKDTTGPASPSISPVNSAVWGSGGMLGAPAKAIVPTPVEAESTAIAPSTPPPNPAKPPPTSLSISTGPLEISPPLAGGKAKRLSLSNYASPLAAKSPTSTSPVEGNHPSRASSLSSTSSTMSPTTPTSDNMGLKIVGGMPATVFFAHTPDSIDVARELPRRVFGNQGRSESWDSIWSKAGKGAAKRLFEQRVPSPGIAIIESSPPKNTTASSSPTTDPLPTPPDSSSSSPSTPNKSPQAMDNELATPPGGSREELDQTPISGRGVPLNDVSEDPPTASNPSTNQDAVEKPVQLSGAGRRTSAGHLKLDMPKRPTFEYLQPSNPLEEHSPVAKASSPLLSNSSLGLIPDGGNTSSPPPRSVDSVHSSASDYNSEDSSASTATPTYTTSPETGLLSPSDSSSNISGLGLSGTSEDLSAAAGGPPAEFLAKYCFYVSSPAISPPSLLPGSRSTGASSRRQHAPGYASPLNGSVYTPPLVGTSSPSNIPRPGLGAGIDTPRASSPGLAATPDTWWAGAQPTPAVVAGGERFVERSK